MMPLLNSKPAKALIPKSNALKFLPGSEPNLASIFGSTDLNCEEAGEGLSGGAVKCPDKGFEI